MWEIIAAAGLCAFAIFGFVAFLKILIFKIYKPENENTYLIVDFKSSADDIEYTLRSRINRIKWMGKAAPERIIILDKNISEEERKIISLICKEYEMIKILKPSELYEILKK